MTRKTDAGQAIPARNGLLEFFRYHGVWAPGVRAFRVMSFAGKSSLIALAFLVPVLVLSALFVPERLDVMRRTSLEQTSLAYAKEAVLLVRRAQDYRAQALRAVSNQPHSDLAKARSALDAQFARLADLDTRAGSQLGTSKALALARGKLEAVPAPTEGLLKVYAGNAKFIESIYALIDAAADGGGLTLDPQLDTSYILNAGVMRMPRLVDEASRMSGLAAAVAAAGEGGAIAGVEINRLDTLVEEHSLAVGAAISRLASVDPQTRAELDLGPMVKLIDALRDESTDEPGTGGTERADKIRAVSQPALDAAWAKQTQMVSTLDSLLAKRARETVRSLIFVSGAVFLSLMIAAYMLYSFFLVVNGGLAEARRHLDRMAEGDLTCTPSPWGRDDSADLMHSLMHMQAAVREIVSGVRGSADQMATSSVEIAQGIVDISARTEHVAQSLQLSSSSMKEISATASETAAVVQHAVGLASESASVAGEGGLIVENMVSTMNAIDASSQQIADIIGVIDGIAFQTNILALNAAVEAARAGVQGRGFAVVATEVRMLAQRSSAAARAIKDLIGNSVQNVAAGTRVVRRAGETMSRIVGNADRVCRLLETIASGAQRQHERVGEVCESVAQIDETTQENASLAGEAAAASGQLSEQSTELLARVARFQLAGSARA